MPNAQLLQWALWGFSLLAGVGTILAMFKLRYAERFLPHWNELKELEATLPIRREELRQATEGIDKCRAEIGQLEATVGFLRILKEWQDANPEAPARIQQMMADVARGESERSAVQQKLAQEESRLNEVTQETSRLNLEKAQLTQETGTLRDQLAGFHRQEAELEKAVRELQDQCSQKGVELGNAQKRMQELQSALTTLEQKVERFEKEKQQAIRERKEAESARDAARAELTGLQKSLDAFKAMAENLNARLKEVDVGHTDLTKALEDLTQPALKFAFSRGARIEESTALRRLADHLRARGLHFPERVQLAFHTSLKAAHINPLVVLAGVSGTGKSALPMAYAEATGMNFLSLAVQPGWSGPQDLLGFYNYLERKYKATELARALAQMSRFSAIDLPGLKIDSRKDQMLLLLLDEMNLARIEYYFSDFLSRLEQRRGRKIEEEQRRREVSLLVDAGSLPATEAPRFIFPDFNVLFVGTMNEDESTQSLSDKVIDRANVLRFGAPKELKASSAPTVAPTADFLPRATWEQWVKPFDGNGFDNERTALTQLNQMLESVNRPFGHRVYRAILDYLANYPGASTDPARCRNALADQIEQKIIPKLRGLDTQDDRASRCLDQLGATISGLQDPELADAFTRAREQHLFEWFGVKRS
ncbi:MAG: AAA family ATPase [Verrucomicrobiae bacterium]|nr:AAA family ATPase [Verrucomicrobiae bacterium]